MGDLISIIVPCYNEEASLRLFHEAVKKTEKSMPDCRFEILLINDGSKDKTVEVMRELATEDPEVSYFSFSRNFGKEAAMFAGFCNARGDFAAVMDADLQDPPDLLPEMYRIIKSGEYDSVAARRVSRKGEPPIRSWFARRFYQLINRISEADIVDGARDFRLMKREMVDAILAMGESNRFSKGIFGWIGFRTYWMPYKNVERVAGETKWNFWSLMGYAIDGIVNFSHVPLDIASCLETRSRAGLRQPVSSHLAAESSSCVWGSSANTWPRSIRRSRSGRISLSVRPAGMTQRKSDRSL